MMPRKKVTSKNDGAMPMVHPNAAAIDVGSTLLMAAVRADRVRAGPRFRDLHDRSASAGSLVCRMRRRDRRDEIDQRLLDSDLRASQRPWLYCVPCQCTRRQARARAQDRRQRCTVAAAASFLRFAATQSVSRPKGHFIELRAYVRQRERLPVCGLAYSAHAEGADRDEPPTPPCRRRYHRRNRTADHPRNPLRRT